MSERDMRDRSSPPGRFARPGYASRATATPNLPIFVAKSNVTGTARLH